MSFFPKQINIKIMFPHFDSNIPNVTDYGVYMSQLIHYVQYYSLYVTTYTLRSRLQFICHNLYTTLKITVYMSQLIHYAQDYICILNLYNVIILWILNNPVREFKKKLSPLIFQNVLQKISVSTIWYSYNGWGHQLCLTELILYKLQLLCHAD